MERLEIGLLGPLIVTVGGRSVVPSAAKQRRLLALLAVNLGREVSMGAIVEELWGGCPPSGPSAAVQTYVKHLRQRIAQVSAADPKEIVARGYGGYRLVSAAAGVDARDFEATVADANRGLASGDDEQGARLLGAGLAMWRGPALDDVQQGGVLRAEALRLDEVRLAALEARIGAELRLGAHTRLVSELMALTTLYPLQENLHAQLILALYRSGRASRALEVFRGLRSTYVRELGIEPSRRLQELHRSVLGCDPTLDAPAAGPALVAL
ncbi:AfsR/SARP family transcriptional regulator [Streptomyces sp. ISL-86]|uniref:AfsR/SARP family transcriptional regulator n=1 Tax=Streptomyces sp. ISL-86 TaxID=2819187 RepID=UPI001BEACC9F|nr:AfsR/SARP family transcriptional regulator [Streptomyces sp. ISL-86]MBT2454389.1 AfsR/SARP family transcriptional regulator [Streptomyces sp. ISL-86]